MFDNIPYLLEWIEDRPEDIRDYPVLAERLAAQPEVQYCDVHNYLTQG